jgi:hypothetical protein
MRLAKQANHETEKVIGSRATGARAQGLTRCSCTPPDVLRKNLDGRVEACRGTMDVRE